MYFISYFGLIQCDSEIAPLWLRISSLHSDCHDNEMGMKLWRTGGKHFKKWPPSLNNVVVVIGNVLIDYAL